jgi:Domain of unknown function (DUF1929)
LRRTAAAVAATMASLAAPVAAQAHGDLPAALAHASARTLNRAEGARLASIHDTSARRREQALYGFESAALGAAHATEHAELRALQRIARTRAGRRRIARAKRRALAAYRRAFPEPRRLLAADAPPSQVGRWERKEPADPTSPTTKLALPVPAINAILLPTGKVMLYAYPLSSRPNLPPEKNYSQMWLWTPGTDRLEEVDPPIDPATGKPYNIWCSGNSLLPSGEVLVTGGNLEYMAGSQYYKGLNKVFTFNPWGDGGRGTWVQQPDMLHGRWYPTQTQLPDGRVLIVSGLTEDAGRKSNLDVEMFTPAPELGGRGTVTKVSTQPYDSTGLYPHTFVVSSGPSAGKVLLGGPWNLDSWLIDPAALKPATATAPDHPGWSQLPNGPGQRYAGNGVYVPSPAGTPNHEALLLGGTDYTWYDRNGTQVPDQSQPGPWITHPTNTSTYVDFDKLAQGWQPGATFNVARAHQNTVLLPDGSMVMVGGGVGDSDPGQAVSAQQWLGTPEQRKVEIRSPLDGKWTLGPAQDETRAYHSTALMLPDGRVMSAGDDWNPDTSTDDAEFYDPPYLFQGARPTLLEMPKAVPYGASFTVKASADARRVVLMAPSAVTHANDMNQHRLELATSGIDGTLTATAPANADQAVPGYYMLLVLNAQGVPSSAGWIHLGFTTSQPTPGPGPAPTPTPTPAPPSTPPTTPPTSPPTSPPPTATPQPKPVVLRLSRAQARREAAAALQRRSRSYRRGSGRQIVCTVSQARGTCTATWRVRSSHRHARVRVTRTSRTTFRVTIR